MIRTSLFSRPLPLPEEMAAWDKASIEEIGLPGAVLMENASREAFHALEEGFGDITGASVLCLAGPGNNGGDAFALARHCLKAGALPSVLHSKPRKDYKGESGLNLRLAAKLGIPMQQLSRVDLAKQPHYDIIIDGLLGTGFHGELRDDFPGWIEWVNERAAASFVMAVDIPSGLNGTSGRPGPIAVTADLTATFEEAKLGLVQPEAVPYIGELVVCEIGIPYVVKQQLPASCALLTDDIAALYPEPEPDTHKGSVGHVLIIGGSPGLSGAPMLSALGALRMGSGLATVACPAGIALELKSGQMDVMTLPLGDGSQWTADMAHELAEHLPRFDALLVGPGLGRAQETKTFLQALLEVLPAEQDMPLLFDADALYHAAEDASVLQALPQGTIVTPHPGEAARLFGIDIAAVQDNRLETAEVLAEDHELVVVLKGAATIIAHPGKPSFFSPFSEPNLAVAGSGDVLAGAILSLCGMGLSGVDAAALGVYVHGFSGELLAEDFPLRGNLASEIAHILPQALKELKSC
jgi:NAD(P)H-hydrate epimerase